MKEEAIKAPGSTIKQYSIMLQNRVGALTALLGLAGHARHFLSGIQHAGLP